MNTTPLIGTGFYANDTEFDAKFDFFEMWAKRHIHPADSDFVVVDNSGPFASHHAAIRHIHFRNRLENLSCEVIRIYNNLGHIGQWIGNKEAPQILGWSMSWIIPALVAYSERRDFVYIEQDCLCFGNWLETIQKDMVQKNLNVAIGRCPASIAACEQSLFYVKCHIIPNFVSAYMSFLASDAVLLPEEKFVKMMMDWPPLGIGYHTLPGGRARPLPYDAPAWYAQKFSPQEIQELQRRKLI